MRAIIWKEWRENIGWALLGMIGVGLAMAAAMHECALDQESLAGNMFIGTTSIVAPILGAALGFLQFIFEIRPGQWELLVQRPISRQRVFFVKVAVGLSLYFAALLIPFAFCVVWAIIPGNVAAPFRWNMTIPGLIDVLIGSVYYFAGVLTARRSARWYVDLCLPLAAALLCSILVLLFEHARTALLTILVFDAMFLVAARGAFLAGGAYPPQHVTAKLAQGVVLFLAITICGGFAYGFIGAFAPTLTFDIPADALEVKWRTYHQLLRDGRLVKVKIVGRQRVSVTDSDGNAVPELLAQSNRVDPLEELAPPYGGLNLEKREKPVRGYRDRYEAGRFRVMSWDDTQWYYPPETGRLIGYDTTTGRYIGSIGPNGFADPGQPATDRFPGERLIYWSANHKPEDTRTLLPTTLGIYRIDPSDQSVELLFQPEQGKQIITLTGIEKSSFGMGGYGYGSEVPKTEYAGNAVLTGDTVSLVDDEFHDFARHKLAFDPSEYDKLNIYKLVAQDTYAFEYYSPKVDPATAEHLLPSQLIVYGPEHQPLVQMEVPPAEREMQGWPRRPATIKSFWGLLIPQAPAVVFRVIPQNRYTHTGFLQYLFKDSLNTVMAVWMIVGSLIGLSLNYFLSRRRAMKPGRKGLWATLGLLLGPSGVLLMLCMQDWPARVRCESCGKPRLVSRVNCEHCGAAFAPPPTDGTEIFDRPAGIPSPEPVA